MFSLKRLFETRKIAQDIIVILVILLVLIYVDKFSFKQHAFIGGRRRFESALINLKNTVSLNEGSYEVAVIGDSSALTGINVNYLTSKIKRKVYNLGTITWVTFAGYYSIISQFTKNNPNLKQVIISVTPSALSHKLEKVEKAGYLNYANWDISEFKGKSFFLFPNLEKANINIRGKLFYNPQKELWPGMNFDQMEAALKENNGFFPDPRIYKWELETRYPDSFFISPFQKKYFSKFVDDCKENNVKLLFIMSPIPQSEYDYHKKRGNIQKIEEELKKFQAENNWLKLANPIVTTYPDKFFATYTHLNPSGSAIYTEYLVDLFNSHFSKYSLTRH